MLESIDGMTIHTFDDTETTWSRNHTRIYAYSFFVGLNFPFTGSWSGIKGNHVYVANLLDSDVIILTTKEGEGVRIEKHNYPLDKVARLLSGKSMRTPIWFRPTLPSLWKSV